MKNLKLTQKPTLIIGIPAYNEQDNIEFLISDLLKQDLGNFDLKKIIIASDGSFDGTVAIAKKYEGQGIEVMDNKDRIGQAMRQNQMIEISQEVDVLVLLNADIRITDSLFISKLAAPVINDDADLTSSSLIESPQVTMIEKALTIGNKIKRDVFNSFQDGDNWYGCHGTARAFSKNLKKVFRFKKSVSEDLYSYLFCKHMGGKFVLVQDAVCYYSLPATIKDHIKQSSRFLNSPHGFYEDFGKEFVTKHTKWPKLLLFRTLCKYLIIDPLPSLVYLAITFCCLMRAKFIKTRSEIWDISKSSKIVRI